MYTDLALYIDGAWHDGKGRKGEDVLNPATEKPLAHLPHASKADLDHALDAAKKGFAIWRNTSAYDRAKIMHKAADLMRERHDNISKIMVQEQGKVYVEARAEVITSADIIDWYAEEGRRSYGRIVPGRVKGTRQLVVQEPVGVVAAFTPWNFPVLTPARKVGGALAAGCSLILKASEETPGACVEMVKCFVDAGLPAGVLNLVFGVPADVSEHLIPKDAIKKISFTGSIPVGKHLAALAGKYMKRTTMELGGHSPVVVFEDADPEKAADTIAAFKYRNAGQVCISPTRFYVQENVYKKFLTRFTEYAKAVKVGDGLEKGITMGSDEDPRIKYVRLARNSGSHAALYAGLHECTGDAAAFLAADMQDPPEIVITMIEHWKGGSDVVWAVRQGRPGEKISVLAFSRIYHVVMKRFVLSNMPEGGADFFLMGRNVMDAYMTIPEKNTDFMNMVLWMGFRQSFIPYVKMARASGVSKWTFSKKVKHFIDSIISFSFVPIRSMSIVGALFAFAGFGYALTVVIGRLFGFVIAGAGFAATMTVLLMGQGFIMLMLGVMGEYVWRTLDEARRRPRYIIQERHGGHAVPVIVPAAVDADDPPGS